MSGDEAFVLLISMALAAIIWFRWGRNLLFANLRPESGDLGRFWLWLAPLVAAIVLYLVLKLFSASDVRDDVVYFFFYMMMGAAWLGLGVTALPFLGLDPRDDVLERDNRAAAMAIAGAIVGITFCFAGGNIGDGPGWWVVVFCAGLATGTLFLLWILLHRLTGAADTITIDRDTASGVRSAGFFLGAGLVLGRSVAGDWEGSGLALRDFALRGWPAIVILALAVVLEQKLRPSAEAPERSALSQGLLPALLLAGLGAFAVYRAGPWA